MGVAILARLKTAALGFGKLLGRGGDLEPRVRLPGRSQCGLEGFWGNFWAKQWVGGW